MFASPPLPDLSGSERVPEIAGDDKFVAKLTCEAHQAYLRHVVGC